MPISHITQSSLFNHQGLSLQWLQEINQKLPNINEIIKLNSFKAEPVSNYFISNNDIKLFNHELFFIYNKYKPTTIETFAKSISSFSYTLTAENRANVVKFFIMFSSISYWFASEKTYIELSLIIIKILKHWFLNNVLCSKDVTSVIQFSWITSLFDIDLYKEESSTLNHCVFNGKDAYNKTYEVIRNIIPIRSTLTFVFSFLNSKDKLNESKKEEFDEIVINCWRFFDVLICNNFNNIVLLVQSNKLIQLIEWSKMCKSKTMNLIINILVKIYKTRFNVWNIYHNLSSIFITDSNSIYNVEEIESWGLFLTYQVRFWSKLFLEEKYDIEQEEILIPNGFYMNNINISGITSSIINAFPPEGYSLVITFCLIWNEEEMKNNSQNIYTVFSISDQIHVYIEHDKLVIKYPEKKICHYSVKPNHNYCLWILHNKAHIRSSKSGLTVYLNCSDKYECLVDYPKGAFSVVLGAYPYSPYERGDCFIGKIGTFILFNHYWKEDNLRIFLNLKGGYENIIYNTYNKHFFSKTETDKILDQWHEDGIIKQIELFISSRSISSFKWVTKPSYKNKIIFKTLYFNIKNEFIPYERTFQTISPPTTFKTLIVYPFTALNSVKMFLKNNGIMFLEMNWWYYWHQRSYEFNLDIMFYNISQVLSLLLELIFGYSVLTNKEYENQLKNIFMTWNELIKKLYSFDIKINYMWLTSFIGYFDFIFKDKYNSNDTVWLDYCGFLIQSMYYDWNDNKSLQILFKGIEEGFTNENRVWLTEKYFQEIIKFEVIYLDPKIEKTTKKSYTNIIKRFLSDSVFFGHTDILKYFISKIWNIQLRDDDEQDDYDCFYTDNSEIMRNTRSNANKANNYKIPVMRITASKRELLNNNHNIPNTNNQLNVVLLYKNLKALYNSCKKDWLYEAIIQLNIHEELIFFFNDEIDQLEDIFKKQIKSYTNSNDELEMPSEWYYAEMIKSICIRFIDEWYYIEKSLLKNKIDIHKTIRSSVSNQNLGKKMRLSSSSTLQHQQTNPCRNNFSNWNLKWNQKKHSTVGSEDDFIIQQFTFFNSFMPSVYTFRSFLLSLYHNNFDKSKISFIKNIKILNLEQIPFETFEQNQYNLIVILLLFNRISKKNCDCISKSNWYMLEYAYDILYNLLRGMWINYNQNTRNDPKKQKEIVTYIFNKVHISSKLFMWMFDSIFLKDIVYVDGTEIINPSVVFKEQQKKVKNKVKANLHEIINETLLSIEEPFYFKMLFEWYINCNEDDFVWNSIQLIINIFSSINPGERANPGKSVINKTVITINNKCLLVWIYKIIFFRNKQNILFKNSILIKNIWPYWSYYTNQPCLILQKSVFPVDDNYSGVGYNSNTISTHRKLIIEWLFEIYFVFYQNGINKDMCEELFNDLFLNKDIELNVNKQSKTPTKSRTRYTINHSICYYIDWLEFNNKTISDCEKQVSQFRNYLESQFTDFQNWGCSITLWMFIKIILHLQELEQNGTSSIMVRCLSQLAKVLYKDIKEIKKKKWPCNPFCFTDEDKNPLYWEFQSYIDNHLKPDDVLNFEKISEIINYESSGRIKFMKVLYNESGEAHFTIKKKELYKSKNCRCSVGALSYNLPLRNSGVIPHSQSKDRINVNESNVSTKIRKNFSNWNSFEHKNLTTASSFFTSNFSQHSQSYKTLNILDKNPNSSLTKDIVIKRKYDFKHDFILKYFNLAFMRFWNYNEEFVKMKKLFKYLYKEDIYDVDRYSINYPTKFKNYISANYSKMFLVHDIFFQEKTSIESTHSYLIENFKYSPMFKTLLSKDKIFQNKRTDNKGSRNQNSINTNNNNIVFNGIPITVIRTTDENSDIKAELITNQGVIFGNVNQYKNCLIFKSDILNDLRTSSDSLDYWFSSWESDFLWKDKEVYIYYHDIQEVIWRNFLFMDISLEFFMRNGKSYWFNFFNTNQLKIVLGKLERKPINIIKDVRKYFKEQKYQEKWLNNEISTFDYLLLINKFSGRSYNDVNKYPLIPWVLLGDGIQIRNFSLPISLQSSERKAEFLRIPNDPIDKENRHHGNHYSTSAYVWYFLMRIQPFTNNMLQFQSNRFDQPDRQFSKVADTLIICNKWDNREPLPELFTMPECWMNLNCNDFGVQHSDVYKRVFNVQVQPFADNAIAFSYKMKQFINTSKEVNLHINKWIDYVFGVEQYTKDNIEGKGFTNFSKYCYSQNINWESLVQRLKKNNKTIKQIHGKIKDTINIIINLGQVPFQWFTAPHSSKVIIDHKQNNDEEQEECLLNSNTINSNPLITQGNNTNKSITFSTSFNTTGEIIYPQDKKTKFKYFCLSNNKKYLYCLTNERDLEIYETSTYKQIKRKNLKHFLFLSKTQSKLNYIDKPNFIFCEWDELNFIFCRYWDNSIKLIFSQNTLELAWDSFVSSIISTTSSDFITGHENGEICHWKIESSFPEINIQLINKIIANEGPIRALHYNKKFNTWLSSDSSSTVIRNLWNFEFINCINIVKESKVTTIVDIKISIYDWVYIMTNIRGDDLFCISWYTMNGIFHDAIKGNFTTFDFTKEGKLIIGYIDRNIIEVYDPANLRNCLYVKTIHNVGMNDGVFFWFNYDEDDMSLFIGILKNEISMIRKLKIDNNKEKEVFK